MKSFKVILTEAKVGVSDHPEKAKLLKELSSWDSDVRKMTKLYKDLKAENSPKAINDFKTTRKYFQTFSQNFEKWVYKYLLNETNGGKEEYYQQEVRTKAWTFINEIGTSFMFPERYNHYTGKHDLAPELLDNNGKNSRRLCMQRYQAAWRNTFKAIKDFIEYESDKSTREELKVEQIQVAGVPIRIDYAKKTKNSNFIDKRFKNFINRLGDEIKLMNKKGFKHVFNNVNIILSYDSDGGDKAGTYSDYENTITIYPWENEGTLVHEIGHHIYRKMLPKKAIDDWSSKIYRRKIIITKKHIEDFINKYQGFEGFNSNLKKQILSDFKKDQELKQIYMTLAEVVPPMKESKDEIREFFKNERMENRHVNLEFITDYANKNSEEAFCEVLKLYVTKGRRRIGNWTYALFKEVVDSAGFRLTENVNSFKDIIKFDYLK